MSKFFKEVPAIISTNTLLAEGDQFNFFVLFVVIISTNTLLAEGDCSP